MSGGEVGGSQGGDVALEAGEEGVFVVSEVVLLEGIPAYADDIEA